MVDKERRTAPVEGGAQILILAPLGRSFLDYHHLKSSTGILQARIISVVVEPMIRLRTREWP